MARWSAEHGFPSSKTLRLEGVWDRKEVFPGDRDIIACKRVEEPDAPFSMTKKVPFRDPVQLGQVVSRGVGHQSMKKWVKFADGSP